MAIGRYLVRAVAGTLLAAGPAWAGAPTDELKSFVDEVTGILADPALKRAPIVRGRRAAIRKVVERACDFPETARRALDFYWRERTEPEQQQFTELFKELLEHTYVSMLELYRGEMIRYVGEWVDGDYATVKTRVTLIKQASEVPVEYRMLQRGDRWLVYDVSIEGVSVIANYRSQLKKVIHTSSYQNLIEQIKVALVELKVEDEAKSTEGRGRQGE